MCNFTESIHPSLNCMSSQILGPVPHRLSDFDAAAFLKPAVQSPGGDLK
jgi:hypothetical protein